MGLSIMPGAALEQLIGILEEATFCGSLQLRTSGGVVRACMREFEGPLRIGSSAFGRVFNGSRSHVALRFR